MKKRKAKRQKKEEIIRIRATPREYKKLQNQAVAQKRSLSNWGHYLLETHPECALGVR